MSTRNKLIILVAVSLLFLAMGAAALTQHTSEQTLLDQQARNAKNSVSLAARNVVREYEILLNTKAAQARALHQSLATLALTLDGLSNFWRDPLEVLRRFPLPGDVTMYVLDASGEELLHRGPAIRVNPYTLRDIKNQPVFSTMMRLARAQQPATCLVRLPSPPRGERLYGRHEYLPKAGLLVGLWQDVTPFDQHQANLRKELLESLRTHFATISIGPSGRLFAVDSLGQTVIGPADLRPDMRTLGPNDEPLLEAMRKAAQTPAIPMAARSADLFVQGENRDVLLFLEHVKEFNWIVGGIAYLDEARAPGRELSFSLALGITATMLIILPFVLLLLAKLTSPLFTLAACARSLPEQDYLQATSSLPELEHLAARSEHEIAELARSLLFMDAALRANVRALMNSTRHKERLQGELTAAAEMQNGFLPQSDLSQVSCGRFALAASLVPARTVGGDLYDYFMLDDNTLCFAIGDVTDKGVAAALFMSMTLSLIRSNAQTASSPEALMAAVNATLAADNPKCMFVTLFIGMLHLPDGTLRYCNGGHNLPLLLRDATAPIALASHQEPPPGVFEETVYTGLEITLLPGDCLFLYTDGLNEAMNAQGEIYGTDQLMAALERLPHADGNALLKTLLDEVAQHVGDTPPSDDTTILCVHYQPVRWTSSYSSPGNLKS